jgi:transcriptional regulator with XRE-family HTH domain
MDGHNDRVQPFPYWLVTFDGTLLRKHRRDRELSQQRLSNRSRVSLGTIQRIEKRPAATCHVSTLYRIAAALSPEDPDALISELTAGSGAPRPLVRRRPIPPPRPEQRWRQGKPFPVSRKENERYDAATARELLTMTGEFPSTKNGMLILLTEYRHALYDIAVRSAGQPN